jgi:hypothetical protein
MGEPLEIIAWLAALAGLIYAGMVFLGPTGWAIVLCLLLLSAIFAASPIGRA